MNMNMGGLNLMPGPSNMIPGNPLLNGMPMNNMISKAKNSDATLYVGNLHPSMEETRIFDIFRSYGVISSCKLMKDLYT